MINNHTAAGGYFGLVLLTLIASAMVLLSSCKIYKPTYYFKEIKKDTIIRGFENKDVELKIQKNDALNISISSLSPQEDGLFNQRVGADSKGSLVDLDGNIYMH